MITDFIQTITDFILLITDFILLITDFILLTNITLFLIQKSYPNYSSLKKVKVKNEKGQ